jgi:dTDP-L-rhamnose 4-epimerase
VTVLDNLLAQVHGARADFGPELRRVARCVRGDARRQADLRPLLQEHELVYWLAAETGTGQSMYRVRRYTEANIGALATLYDVLVQDRGTVTRIVLTSSRAIYGEGTYTCPHHGVVVPDARAGYDPVHQWNPHCSACTARLTPRPTTESSPPRPGSVYGWTKLAQEQLLALLTAGTGVSAVVLRLQNVYGPGQALRNPYTGVLMTFCNRALRGEPLVLYEDGDITRDFVHVDDVAAALAVAGRREDIRGGVFNIGSGVPTTIRAAAEVICAAAGSRSDVTVGGQFRVGDVRYAVADLQHSADVLGYRPTVGFAEGVDRLIPWVQAQGAVRDRSGDSVRELAARGLLKTAP